MVASCSMMAVYHRQDDDLLSHELLEAGQIATATTACVLLVWCVFSGLSDVRFWLNRTLAIRSIWGNDEDLWWRNCIRVPVSSMLQQNVTDDEDDDDLKDEADGPITKAVKGEEHDVQARSLRFPSAPPTQQQRPLNIFTDDLDGLPYDDIDEDDGNLILMQYVAAPPRETRGVRLPSGHEWAALRAVEPGMLDAQLMGRRQDSPAASSYDPNTNLANEGGKDAYDDRDDASDDVVVDYADVEFLGGNINANAQLLEMLTDSCTM
ncbi:Hypothetical protein, putative [Bodo saltans]|uniref:Uncharacterized protein n=1 Tax=Bodo saltans TaxID=75058 RepID=A0A0S4JHC3_BODSA|nr:Hypothetical protein, putative [Bodo saltans]|eukprot:CUG87790.1 Hypothetical protein, putative [Bodo saltans]